MLSSTGAAGGEQGPLGCAGGREVGVPHCAAQGTHAADPRMRAPPGSTGITWPRPRVCLGDPMADCEGSRDRTLRWQRREKELAAQNCETGGGVWTNVLFV